MVYRRAGDLRVGQVIGAIPGYVSGSRITGVESFDTWPDGGQKLVSVLRVDVEPGTFHHVLPDDLVPVEA